MVAGLLAGACGDPAGPDPGPTPDVDTDAETDADTDAGADGAAGDDAPPPLHPRVDVLPASEVRIETDAGTVSVLARVADEPDARRHGLMGVEELPEGVGMLFVFEAEREGAFWMKDTLVPLDIAFAGDDGTIREILTMSPCDAEPCPTYDPEVAYRTALEVPAGWFARQGVEAGDRLEHDAG